jgi:alkanesulfonate monooxygenase SsuD/methylene tetrahydromethanopterin reductase-like flavin-dependent oxidoreductase (luciferase family)
MRALWTMRHPQYAGKYVAFEGVNAYPRPIQPDGPPIVVGGNSDAALQRAATYGDGWYGVRLDLAQTRDTLARLREIEHRHRDGGRAPLEISVLPSEPLSAETISAYGHLGVERLVVWPPESDASQLVEFLRSNAPAEFKLECPR